MLTKGKLNVRLYLYKKRYQIIDNYQFFDRATKSVLAQNFMFNLFMFNFIRQK